MRGFREPFNYLYSCRDRQASLPAVLARNPVGELLLGNSMVDGVPSAAA